jgi:hypothetical protein
MGKQARQDHQGAVAPHDLAINDMEVEHLRPRIPLAIAICLFVLASHTGLARGRDIRVQSSEATLGQALTRATAGDRVILAPGRHFANHVDLVDGVTIVGDIADPGSVIIDGGSEGRVLRAEGLTWARIAGVTITGGSAVGNNSYASSGGGLFVSSSKVVLEAVYFVSNRAESAGGCLRASNSELEIDDCFFIGGSAVKGGGAIDLSYGSMAQIRNSLLKGNEAAWGGAISARTGSSCWFYDSTFEENSTTAPQELGGAFFADYAAHVAFHRCILERNRARQGGAVRVRGAITAFLNCTLRGNLARESGGPFMVENSALFLDHTIVAFNEGSPEVASDVNLTVWASDIYGNQGGDWVGVLTPLSLRHGNLEVDPLFCSEQDLHLQEDSPCADTNSSVGLIGALGAGCEADAVALERFGGSRDGDSVVLTWRVSGGEDLIFRLQGRTGDGAVWTVDYSRDTIPGYYRAKDRPPSFGRMLEYTLEYRTPTGVWTALGETSLDTPNKAVPEALEIESIYPNPFNPRVTVRYVLGETTEVRATIYDLQGRVVFPIVRGVQAAGSRTLSWDGVGEHGRPMPTGTYILRIDAGGQMVTRKLTLVR